MKPAQTRILKEGESANPAAGFRSAVSLHSHTNQSKETLDFLPRYIHFHRIPAISWLVQSELKRYESRSGRRVDFRQAYWTPPVAASMVFASEKSQIEEKLGLAALVSITDHDTIGGCLALQTEDSAEWAPLSLEWSVPFAGNTFHIGVHNLAPASAMEVIRELGRYTAEPKEERLGDLFALLDSSPDTLLVLNHPCCNFVRVGTAKHWDTLRKFIAQCRPWIHALEVNGMRPWKENQTVLRMAKEYDFPIVAGGDRHGCRPNVMLNLSEGESWSDFAARIRSERNNDIFVLSAYDEPIRLRELATAADVLRRYPGHPYGQRRFLDRIFAHVDGYNWRPLSFYWDGSERAPIWLIPAVNVVIALGSDHIRPMLRRLVPMNGPDYSSEAMNMPTDD